MVSLLALDALANVASNAPAPPCWEADLAALPTPRYERPAEVDLLIGDPAKAKRQLGWEPKVKFKELVAIMVDADLKLAEEETKIKDALSQ